ncbi:hypothetical protein ACE0DR_28880 [Azotobacter sp. CWF10]
MPVLAIGARAPPPDAPMLTLQPHMPMMCALTSSRAAATSSWKKRPGRSLAQLLPFLQEARRAA